MARLAGKGTHYRLAVLDATGQPTDNTFDLPSVTTILDSVISKPALQYWTYKKTIEGVGELVTKYGGKVPNDPASIASLLKTEGLRPMDMRDKAAKHGTNQHDLLEQLATNGKRAATKLAKEALGGAGVNPVAEWWVSERRTVEACEVPVVSFERGYAGTLDMVYVTEAENPERVLLDLKTGGVYLQSFLQLAAYKLAWEEQGGKNIDVLSILQCPKVGGTYTVHTVRGTEIERLQERWSAALGLYKCLPKTYKAGEVVTTDLTQR